MTDARSSAAQARQDLFVTCLKCIKLKSSRRPGNPSAL